MFFGIELSLIVVCIIVVLGRIVDMSLATLRTVYTVKAKPQIAAPIGFIEAFFWFVVVKAALDFTGTTTIDTLSLAVAYSLGFALGTFLGGFISNKFIKSKIHVQIVLSSKNDELVEALTEKGFGQTIITAKGAKKNTETYMIFVETDSDKIETLKETVDSMDEKAFISISESKSVYNGYYGIRSTRK